MIQVRCGPRIKVEVLPLTMVNMLHKMDSETMMQEVAVTLANTHRDGKSDAILRQPSLCEHLATGRTDAWVSDSDSNADEDREGGLQLEEPVTNESEFGNTELEDLVVLEGPQQMLQLTLQEQADDFMKEEITDADDYADWIRWVSDVEQGKQALPGAANCVEVPVLLQVQQVDTADSHDEFRKQLALSNNWMVNSRWEEICKRIRIDQNLDAKKGQQLWGVLERYQDVFAWNKGELGCCTVREHSIDTQGFPPCKVALGRLSYWEEAEVKRHIDVLVELGKMKPSDSDYACCVTLPVKKDGSRRFYGDYRPLNL